MKKTNQIYEEQKNLLLSNKLFCFLLPVGIILDELIALLILMGSHTLYLETKS